MTYQCVYYELHFEFPLNVLIIKCASLTHIVLKGFWPLKGLEKYS